MSDFLPIGLGRDGFDNVSHFKEITTSDSIPEQYLQISNTVAKWNASAIQDFPVCTTDPTTGQVLVYNGSEWCPSTLAAGGGGGGSGGVSGTGTAGRIPSWTGDYTIGNWGPSIPDGNILRWDSTTFLPEDTGLKNTDAGWNASGINGVSACPDVPTNGQIFVYNSSIGAWCPSTVTLGGGSGDATSIHGSSVPNPTIGPQPAGDVLVWTGTSYDWEPRVKISGSLTANKIITTNGTDLVDSGYAKTDAAWNASGINGVSATIPTTADNNKVLTYSSSLGQYTWTDKIRQAQAIGTIGGPEGDGLPTTLVVGTSGGGSYTVSGLSTGVFLVASGNSVVPAFLPESLLRFYGATNGSFPTKAPPAELAKNGGEILYYDVTNDRYTSTGGLTSSSLKVVNQNSLQVNNLSAAGSVSVSGNLIASGTITASNISTSATANYIPKAKSSGKIDYTWLEEASIDDFAKAGTTNYTAWYAAGLMTGVTLATFTMTANRLYAMPLVSPRRGSTIDDIEIYVTTGVASTSAIMGLYTNGGEADLYPDTLVASASAELDTTTTAQKRTWNIAYTLNPGQLYWLAVVSNGAPVIRGLSTNQAHYILGTASSANTTWTTHLYATHTYDSSLPSTFPTAGATAGTGAAPGLFYDFSA